MGQVLVVLAGFVALDLALLLAFGLSGRRCLAGFLAFGLPLLAIVGLVGLVARALEGRRS
jgi:hypothetical protein